VDRFVKAVAFDLGHTLVDEHTDRDPLQLMPDVPEVLTRIGLPMAVWSNTRDAREAEVRGILKAVQIEQHFSWVVTSVDAGFRKPAREFFQFALARWPFAKNEILFVGNQLNTDVLGAQSCGIRTAWLSAPEFRSDDETMTLDDVTPTYILLRFSDVLSLLKDIS
jgi:FMN phosphatase YigB (HAD superfamily)